MRHAREITFSAANFMLLQTGVSQLEFFSDAKLLEQTLIFSSLVNALSMKEIFKQDWTHSAAGTMLAMIFSLGVFSFCPPQYLRDSIYFFCSRAMYLLFTLCLILTVLERQNRVAALAPAPVAAGVLRAPNQPNVVRGEQIRRRFVR